jgi:hypothetical protein
VKNQITDLRNHLFAALEGLSDTENPLDIERAKAISEVAKTVIESAKVEVEFLKASGATTASGFFTPSDQLAKVPRELLTKSGKQS